MARTEQQLKELAALGSLFGVRRTNGEFVALCYALLDGNEWEIGGLTVAPEIQRHGLGETLTRLALAHTMAFQDPWKERQHVITHVHEANQAPRSLLAKLGFRHIGQIEAPPNAPPSMKRNKDGKVIGDKFKFTVEGLKVLCCWLNDFTGTLRSGASAKLTFGPVGLTDLRKALKDMAAREADCDPKCGHS